MTNKKILFTTLMVIAMSACGPNTNLNEAQMRTYSAAAEYVRTRFSVDPAALDLPIRIEDANRCETRFSLGCTTVGSDGHITIDTRFADLDPIRDQINGFTFCEVLTHELTHLAMLALGTDGDPSHKTPNIWYSEPRAFCSSLKGLL